MKIMPMPTYVFGKLIDSRRTPSLLFLPHEDNKKENQIIRVTHRGEKVDPQINVGTLLLLNHERYGSQINIEDDVTGETETFEVVDANPDKNYIMAAINEDA